METEPQAAPLPGTTRSATPSRTAAPGVPRSRRTDWRAIGVFALMTAPILIGIGIFKYVAIGWSFLLSFSKADRSISLGHWVGFANYSQLLGDPDFRKSITQIVLFTLFIVPVTFAASLGLALMVHRIRRGRALFRTTFLIPAAVSYVAGSLVWKMCLFSSLPGGLANTVGGWFGASPTPWLQQVSPPVYWVVIVTLRLWLQVGFFMILLLAGLQGIPKEIYEAAELDGATGWRKLRRITLPLLRNTSVAVLMLLFIAAFQAFDEFYNLFTGGGAATSGAATAVKPPLVYLYDKALGDQNYGLGSAGSFVVTGLIVLVTLLQGRLTGFGKSEE
ncbi:sugar ABC transporter permease [Catenulispora subtropica]|uniref:Sugar ABC transporter permease n=1 Tax=Catenulispora subtropica TaxID=450798 RepID=A0ABN2SII1_9ACTN